MPAIAIVTDTDSSLPADVAARFGIRQVPIGVHFGQETLKAVVDIDDASLFARVDREHELPTTSAPSPGEFQEAYVAGFDAGADSIVCICVSSEVSGVYAAATSARKLMAERDISVIDDGGYTVRKAYRWAKGSWCWRRPRRRYRGQARKR